MAASSIFFMGRLIRTPGSYSVTDASGLEQVGLGATGIVAVLGTAVGGKPMTAITEVEDLLRATKPEKIRELFLSGQLREVGDMLFAPSKDPDIPGGAVEVVPCKVNPATVSTGALPNAYGVCLDLTSIDYGAHTAQVNITVGTGTNKGKLVTITFEDSVETVDDLGGDTMFNLKYVDSGAGWDTMTAEVESSGAVVAKGTLDEEGQDDEITAQPAAASVLSVKSAQAADITQQVVVYGINALGTAAVSETINLDDTDGTTRSYGTTEFSVVCGARVIGTTTGIVTVEDDDPVTILTITAGAAKESGLVEATEMYSAGIINVVCEGASVKDVVVVGLSATGAAQVEMLTLNDTTLVAGVATWSEIQYLALGDCPVAAGFTLTFSGEAGRTVPATTHNTLQKVADYYNSRAHTPVATTYGFVLTIVTGLTSLDPANFDTTTGAGGAVSCLSPADPDFYADQYLIVDWINGNSQRMTAAVASGAVGGAPTNTTAAVYLSGGIEGVVTSQHWQDTLNLLKQARVNSVVVLTHDPSVHAQLDAHCAYCAGIGRSERDGFVGLMKSDGSDLATKAETKAQIVNLNTRHIRAFSQAADRYNTDGDREEFAPYYLAAIAAGMQAGSSVGTSLTYKYANVLSFRQFAGATGWNPTDDSEEMIAAGLCFLESVPGIGRRFVRKLHCQ